MCATYRFEGGATRLRVRARTTEGDYGDVRLTVVAKIPPKKSAQVRCAIDQHCVHRKWDAVVWSHIGQVLIPNTIDIDNRSRRRHCVIYAQVGPPVGV